MGNLHDGVTGDDWRPMAEIYKKLTVGTSAKPIAVMLERMNAVLPFSQATGIYDNGTGPGAVISRIISDYGSEIPPSTSLACSDYSEHMVEQVRVSKAEEIAKNSASSSLWSKLDAQVRDAMDLEGVADESQSHVTAGWVYFLTPDPQKCLSESKRVLQPNGVLSCSSWKTSQWMESMRLVEKVRPGIQMPSVPTEWATASSMQAELEKAGFREVSAEEVEVTMSFNTYDAFVEVLLCRMPMMVNLTKDFSDDERATLRQLVLVDIHHASPSEPGSLRGTALVATGRK